MVSVDDSGGFEGFIAHQDGCAVVVLRGEVDMAVIAAFTALLDQAIVASPHLVLDMADVTFLDSSGLRVIAMASLQVAGHGSVSVRNASRAVARVFELSGMNVRIDVEPIAID